jgi:hypothetical protein
LLAPPIAGAACNSIGSGDGDLPVLSRKAARAGSGAARINQGPRYCPLLAGAWTSRPVIAGGIFTALLIDTKLQNTAHVCGSVPRGHLKAICLPTAIVPYLF